MTKSIERIAEAYKSMNVEDAAMDKARADFFKKGGKITKLPPGKAAGYHGKEDPGAGIKGMIAKDSAKNLKLSKHGKHLDTSTPVHKDVEKNEGMKKKTGFFDPRVKKDVQNMAKDPKYKGNNTGFEGAVRKKHGAHTDHFVIQNIIRKHAETESVSYESKINEISKGKARKYIGYASRDVFNLGQRQGSADTIRRAGGDHPDQDYEKGPERKAAKRVKGIDRATKILMKKKNNESISLKSFDEIRKQYSPQTHEWGTEASTRWAKSMTPGESVQSESTIYESTNWKGGSKHVGLARYAAKQGYGLQITQAEPMPGQQKRFKGAYVSIPVKDIPKLIKALQKVHKAPANVQMGDDD